MFFLRLFFALSLPRRLACRSSWWRSLDGLMRVVLQRLTLMVIWSSSLPPSNPFTPPDPLTPLLFDPHSPLIFLCFLHPLLSDPHSPLTFPPHPSSFPSFPFPFPFPSPSCLPIHHHPLPPVSPLLPTSLIHALVLPSFLFISLSFSLCFFYFSCPCVLIWFCFIYCPQEKKYIHLEFCFTPYIFYAPSYFQFCTQSSFSLSLVSPPLPLSSSSTLPPSSRLPYPVIFPLSLCLSLSLSLFLSLPLVTLRDTPFSCTPAQPSDGKD